MCSEHVQKYMYMIPLKPLKDIRLVMFCGVIFINELGMYVPIDFLPDWMVKEHGIPQLRAGYIISLYGVSSIIGRLLAGILTSCMERLALPLVAVSMILLGSSCYGMAVSTDFWQFAIFICIYGVFLGMFGTLRTISLASVFGVDSLKENYAIIMFVGGVSTVFGAPFAGWLKVCFGSYYYAFVVTSGIYICGGVLALILVEENKKDKYHIENVIRAWG